MFYTEDLFEQCMALRCEVKSLRHTVKEFKSGKRYLKLQADQHRVIEGYVKDIRKLRHELADAHARIVSTNTNIPTSQTPAEKEKRRPNSREKSGKPKGGQPGHEKHSLKEPDESEITDTVEYGSDIDDFECPSCGSGLYIPTGKSEVKYEYESPLA